jgi:ribosomal protein S18 acetylase RimI-like enzyme
VHYTTRRVTACACRHKYPLERESSLNPVTIRHAGPGDEAAIVRLVHEMAAEDDEVSPVDEHYVRHFLASPVSGALLACEGDDAVGLLSYVMTPGLFHAADSGLIELLIVTAARRDEGIGRRLVDKALRLFREAGCAEASVSTGEANRPAQHVYRDAGLTENSLLLEKHFGG